MSGVIARFPLLLPRFPLLDQYSVFSNVCDQLLKILFKSSYAREGHHVLSQLFDWQRFIYHNVYCSNGWMESVNCPV